MRFIINDVSKRKFYSHQSTCVFVQLCCIRTMSTFGGVKVIQEKIADIIFSSKDPITQTNTSQHLWAKGIKTTSLLPFWTCCGQKKTASFTFVRRKRALAVKIVLFLCLQHKNFYSRTEAMPCAFNIILNNNNGIGE